MQEINVKVRDVLAVSMVHALEFKQALAILCKNLPVLCASGIRPVLNEFSM